MFYIDTSVLVAYYCPEALSDQVEHYLMRGQFVISPLTEVELFSAVSRKIREGQMHSTDGRRVLARYLSHAEGNFYLKVSIDSHHYRLARDWLGEFSTPLRSFDALHLAVAVSEDLTPLTSDRAFSKSANALGIKTVFLGV
ncbi:MAG: type II toxin-antitoxin system VapC family toxin [Chlamydiae bacterium]|nr:type II toxin-antitoxin system VapC family toxin [Chlamydiota bacterium]MBI3266893.1 type II toxin-antitoxin system VapC family toxin [Chlamydiota bacterium]